MRDKVIFLIASYAVIGILFVGGLILLTGCTVKVCNCGEVDKPDKSKHVDGNSKLFDFDLSPTR